MKVPVHVTLLLDESESMSSCKDATISGYNEYINSLKQQENIKFTLTKFNSDGIKTVYLDKDINEIPMMGAEDFIPDSMTPLYDAIGQTITILDAKIKPLKEHLQEVPVIFVIITDGEENTSKEYTRANIFNLIQGKTKEKWEFVYIGANQDMWKSSQDIGLPTASAMAYDSSPIGTQTMYTQVSTQTSDIVKKLRLPSETE